MGQRSCFLPAGPWIQGTRHAQVTALSNSQQDACFKPWYVFLLWDSQHLTLAPSTVGQHNKPQSPKWFFGRVMSRSLLPLPPCSWTHAFYYWGWHCVKFFDGLWTMTRGSTVTGLFSHLLDCTSVLFADMMLYEILWIWIKCFINPLWWCLPRPYIRRREAHTQPACLLLS